MLADKLNKLMGVDNSKPLAEKIYGLMSDTGNVLKTAATEVAKAPVQGATIPAGVAPKPITDKVTKPIDTVAIPLTEVPRTTDEKKSILDRIKTFDFSDHWTINDTRKSQVDTMLEAIAQNETSVVEGDKYAYRKPADKDDPTNFDNGKYQVTTNELKTYAKRFLGKQVTDKEFLKSPQMQETYMRNKVRFMMDEGLTPGEMFASHRGGLPNWGNEEKMNKKRKDYPEYIKSGVDKYLKDLQTKDPVAYQAQLEVYKGRIGKPKE